MTKASRAFCALLALTNLPVVKAQTSLYATGTDGLYTINTATGAATAVGAPSSANLAGGGLAYDSADSTLYATGLDNSSHSAFYSLNPGTGAATEIAQITGGYSFDLGGLAYDGTDNVLYATGTNGGSSTSLFSINPSTGAASLIATTTTTTTTTVANPNPPHVASQNQIASLQTQIQSLQAQLANLSSPLITAIQNQINNVTQSLNTQIPNLNNQIGQLNALVASEAVSEGIVGLLTIHPIPPSTITTTTTNNFTLLGLGYKAATGTLYADGTIGGDVSGQGAAVFTLNRSTGAPTTLGYAGVTAGSSLSSGGLAYDPATGALYSIGSVTGSSDGLYTINTSTGDATLVATFSPDIGALGGLAFAPTAIPEPSAFASIVGVAALGLAAWRRGRWRR